MLSLPDALPISRAEPVDPRPPFAVTAVEQRYRLAGRQPQHAAQVMRLAGVQLDRRTLVQRCRDMQPGLDAVLHGRGVAPGRGRGKPGVTTGRQVGSMDDATPRPSSENPRGGREW